MVTQRARRTEQGWFSVPLQMNCGCKVAAMPLQASERYKHNLLKLCIRKLSVSTMRSDKEINVWKDCESPDLRFLICICGYSKEAGPNVALLVIV